MSIFIARSPAQVLQAAWKRVAPLELAETSWDNVGLMIEAPYPKENAKKILLTIDLTTDVCSEALLMKDCSLIIAYHPPIFSGLKKLTLQNPLQASLLRLAASGISVFSPHTSLDAVKGGINDWLALPFLNPHPPTDAPTCLPLKPSFSATSPPPKGLEEHAGAGMGRMVRFAQGGGWDLDEIVGVLKGHLGVKYCESCNPNHLRRSESAKGSEINSIAICAGSGGSLFKGVDADLYITGEMSHHEILFLTSQQKSVLLAGHSNTERPYLRHVLARWLKREMDAEERVAEELGREWEVVCSEVDAEAWVVV